MTNEPNKSPPLTDAERAVYWENLSAAYRDKTAAASRRVETLESTNAELLEALEALYRTSGSPIHADERRAQELASAAIAKARGQK